MVLLTSAKIFLNLDFLGFSFSRPLLYFYCKSSFRLHIFRICMIFGRTSNCVQEGWRSFEWSFFVLFCCTNYFYHFIVSDSSRVEEGFGAKFWINIHQSSALNAIICCQWQKLEFYRKENICNF